MIAEQTGRPGQLVVVLGTGTDVGKTWLTCELIRSLRSRGYRVSARKPAQSFEPGDVAALVTDAHLLAAASGENVTDVCRAHRWYAIPMAPPMAAESLGLPTIRINELLAELTWPSATRIGFVETAGGVRSPIADDGDCLQFARRLHPDRAILVADAGLGTINALRLSMTALEPIRPLVFLNHFDPKSELHRRNHDWLRDRDEMILATSTDDVVRWIVSEP